MPQLPPDRFLPRGLTLALWLLALPVLLAGLGEPVVQRAQEARVLETAREMLDADHWRDWLIPRFNGEVRMQKPPLAYWVSVASFRALGVSDFAGRLPFAVAGWLLLAVVYRFAGQLFGDRFGFFSAAILLTSYMFFRNARLAETDALAALFVTASVHSFWLASTRRNNAVRRFHLGALAAALAVLAKGPPAVFPFLFLVAFAVVERNALAVRRFLASGALLTFAVAGGAWYAYAFFSPYGRVLRHEVGVIAVGSNHFDWPWVYVPHVLLANGPWAGLFVLGLVEAVRDWRRDPRARVFLVYAAVVLVPLCLIGNKQSHYLVPLAPALAMVCAYAIERAVRGGPDRATAPVARAVFAATLAVSFAAPAAVLAIARRHHGALSVVDVATTVVLFAAAVAAVSTFRQRGLAPAAAVYAAGLALAMAVTFGRWLPSLDRVTHRTIAREIRGAFGDGPYAFYGPNISLPLIWNLRAVAPQYETEPELRARLAVEPATVVIAQTKNNQSPPPIPEGLDHVGELPEDHETVFNIYAEVP